MPILLSQPFNPGDLDPNQTYPRAKINFMEINMETKSIQVGYTYGDVSGSAWIRGLASPMEVREATGPDYDMLVATTGSFGESIYNTGAFHLYTWLLDNGHLSGTIE